MTNKTAILEWSSVGVLVFTLLFTLLFSFGYATDISNHDYLYYMHLVAEGDYHNNPMIAGTIALYKPIFTLFGHNYWMWQKFAWLINTLTVLIPYFALLKGNQRKKYAFLVAYVLLIVQWRFGCEPYKPTYLFSIIMLTSLVKYVSDKRTIWVFIISVMLSLITFVRFPSIIIFPILLIAIAIITPNKLHTLIIFIITILLFIFFVTFTNENIVCFCKDLVYSMEKNVQGRHSIKNIIEADIRTLAYAGGYTFFVIMPFLAYLMCQIKRILIFKVLFISCCIILFGIILFHANQHLCLALMSCVILLYCYEKHFCSTSIVLGLTVEIVAILGCVASDMGFIHNYMSTCFLPYFTIQTSSINSPTNKTKQKNNENSVYSRVNNGLFKHLFFVISILATTMTFGNRTIYLYNNFCERNRLAAINGSQISPNLSNVYLGENTFDIYSTWQKQYEELSRKYNNVIFWGGVSTHVMSFANNKWPVTDVWDITSKNTKGKVFCDFKEYVTKNRPAVIDLERHDNTKRLLLSLGYKETKKDTYNVYTLDNGDK